MRNKEENEIFWNAKAKETLVGKKIVMARYLTSEEAEDMGWYKRGLMFRLDDSTECLLSADDEGNDSGVLFFANDETSNGVLPSLY